MVRYSSNFPKSPRKLLNYREISVSEHFGKFEKVSGSEGFWNFQQFIVFSLKFEKISEHSSKWESHIFEIALNLRTFHTLIVIDGQPPQSTMGSLGLPSHTTNFRRRCVVLAVDWNKGTHPHPIYIDYNHFRIFFYNICFSGIGTLCLIANIILMLKCHVL